MMRDFGFVNEMAMRATWPTRRHDGERRFFCVDRWIVEARLNTGQVIASPPESRDVAAGIADDMRPRLAVILVTMINTRTGEAIERLGLQRDRERSVGSWGYRARTHRRSVPLIG